MTRPRMTRTDHSAHFFALIPTSIEDYKKLNEKISVAYNLRCDELSEAQARADRAEAIAQRYRDALLYLRGHLLPPGQMNNTQRQRALDEVKTALLPQPEREDPPSEDEPDEREETMKRYGLPEAQAASAVWRRFDGPTDETVRVELNPGQVLELWPGGAVFNEHGTLLGWLEPASNPAPSSEAPVAGREACPVCNGRGKQDLFDHGDGKPTPPGSTRPCDLCNGTGTVPSDKQEASE